MYSNSSDEGHDVAQICLEGHVTNSASRIHPQSNVKYCKKCGKKTITQCPCCNMNIRGQYHNSEITLGSMYSAPNHCPNCGKPFPWIQSRIKLAKEFIEDLELQPKDKTGLQNEIENIVCDTQRTEFACYKFKRIISTLSNEIQDLFKKIFTVIATDKANELLGNIISS